MQCPCPRWVRGDQIRLAATHRRPPPRWPPSRCTDAPSPGSASPRTTPCTATRTPGSPPSGDTAPPGARGRAQSWPGRSRSALLDDREQRADLQLVALDAHDLASGRRTRATPPPARPSRSRSRRAPRRPATASPAAFSQRMTVPYSISGASASRCSSVMRRGIRRPRAASRR